MNTYARTTDAAFSTQPSIPILGLWSGDVPTTLQHSSSNMQASVSTVALALLTMLGGIAFSSYEPPTFADTAKIVTPSRFNERKNAAPFGYEISQSQVAVVNTYLNQHTTSRDFLREVAVIIDRIYGSKVIREIHVVEDIDTGKTIMELTIKSGLALDDEFVQKDELLFQRIGSSGLTGGLHDVVISQG